MRNGSFLQHLFHQGGFSNLPRAGKNLNESARFRYTLFQFAKQQPFIHNQLILQLQIYTKCSNLPYKMFKSPLQNVQKSVTKCSNLTYKNAQSFLRPKIRNFAHIQTGGAAEGSHHRTRTDEKQQEKGPDYGRDGAGRRLSE
ncbi:MAG: hypothetical protein K2M74_04105, partial [Bacteroidales bacterium]|nr:hypothetical protein [Bacteroidales bacterium]